MKNLLLLACMALCMHGMSQNAFYDAKKIAAWANQIKENQICVSCLYNDTIAGTILRYSHDKTWNSLLLSSRLSKFNELYQTYLKSKGLNDKVDYLTTQLQNTYDILGIDTRSKLKIYYDSINLLNQQILQNEAAILAHPDSLTNQEMMKAKVTAAFHDSLLTILFKNKMMALQSIPAQEDIRKTALVQTLIQSMPSLAGTIADTPSVLNDSTWLTDIITKIGKDIFNSRMKQLQDSVLNNKQATDSSQLIDSLYKVKLAHLKTRRTGLNGALYEIKGKFARYFSGSELTDLEKQQILKLTGRTNLTEYIPYFSSEPAYISQTSQKTSDEARELRMSQSTALSNFKLPSQSEVIDALAIYLAKRVKQEAVLYFMQELKDRFNSKRMIQELFHNSFVLLTNTDLTQSPGFGTEWKYAFSKDLSRLPQSIIQFAAKNDYLKKEAGKVFADILQITTKIQSKYNFIEIAQSIQDSSVLYSQSIRAFAAIINVFNNELFDTNGNRNYWISFQDFESSILRNPDQCQLFFSLLAQRYPRFIEILGLSENDINNDKAKIRKIAEWMSSVLISLDHFQRNQRAQFENNNQNYVLVSYWTLFSDIIKQVLKDDSHISASWLRSEHISSTLDRVDALFEIFTLIENGNYSGSAQASVNMLTEIIGRKQRKNSAEEKTIEQIRKIVSLMADVTKAKDSKQLAEVIEANALPPSSYRYRFKYKNSIDIGAYVGVYAGMELVQNTGTSKQYSQPGFVYGLTAPIGINFNRRNTKGNYSTVSLSLIDIGAVVSYRLSNDAEAPLPNTISWSQVLSPGLYYRPKWGLKKTPLVWSIGAQYAPKLRVLNGVNENNTIRFSFGAALDMPLLVLRRKE